MPHKATDSRFASLIDINAPVAQLGSGFTFTEGPLWHPTENHLLFSDMPADVRRRPHLRLRAASDGSGRSSGGN